VRARRESGYLGRCIQKETRIGCCLVFGILAASPRLILFGMWLFTDYLA